MNKALISLWVVVGLFALGFVGVIVAAFTTVTTNFAGEAVVQLAFVNAESSVNESSIILSANFEARETNIFDTLSGGPKPRKAVVGFDGRDQRRHELTFLYDREGNVWKADVTFPDPLIASLEIEKSSLDFKGVTDGKPRFESLIVARALTTTP